MENDSRMWSNVLEWIFPDPAHRYVDLDVPWLQQEYGRRQRRSGGVFNVGKSTGKLADKEKVNVTFKDVAGLYGAKEEVMEIVDFLKNPKKYTALGGKKVRSPPGWPSGYRKDIAGQGSGRGSQRSVLLDFRFGFRRDVRRCRCFQGP